MELSYNCSLEKKDNSEVKKSNWQLKYGKHSAKKVSGKLSTSFVFDEDDILRSGTDVINNLDIDQEQELSFWIGDVQRRANIKAEEMFMSRESIAHPDSSCNLSHDQINNIFANPDRLGYYPLNVTSTILSPAGEGEERCCVPSTAFELNTVSRDIIQQLTSGIDAFDNHAKVLEINTDLQGKERDGRICAMEEHAIRKKKKVEQRNDAANEVVSDEQHRTEATEAENLSKKVDISRVKYKRELLVKKSLFKHIKKFVAKNNSLVHVFRYRSRIKLTTKVFKIILQHFRNVKVKFCSYEVERKNRQTSFLFTQWKYYCLQLKNINNVSYFILGPQHYAVKLC